MALPSIGGAQAALGQQEPENKTLQGAIEAAQNNTMPFEDQKRLRDMIVSGEMDEIAANEGIDLTSFKERHGVAAAPTEVEVAETVDAPENDPKKGTIRNLFANREKGEAPLDPNVDRKGIPGIIQNTVNTATSSAKQVGTGLRDMAQGMLPGKTVLEERLGEEGKTPEQKNRQVAAGFSDLVDGIQGVLFSPVAGAVQEIPGEIAEDVLTFPRNQMAKVIENAAEKKGIDTTDPEWRESVLDPALTAFDLSLYFLGPAGRTKTGQNIKAKVKDFSNTVRQKSTNLTESTVSKVSGLKPETVRTILEAPDKVAKLQQMTPDIARNNLFDKVKTNIDTALDELSSTGKEYGTIRNSGATVNFADDFWKGWLDDNGLTLGPENKIKSSSKSKIRSANDVNKLQGFFDTFVFDEAGQFRKAYSADEFLNMRSDLSDLAKFDSTTTNNLTNAAKDIRFQANKNKGQITGLTELDAKFGSKVEFLNKVKNTIYKKNGELKTNAVSTINNLLNKGKEQQLAILDEFMPGLADEVRALRAIQDVEAAKGSKIWSNVRTGSELFFVGQGNLPVAGAILLTSPSVIVPMLKAYGRAKTAMTNAEFNSILSKVESGTKLSTKETSLVSELIQSLSAEDIIPILNASSSVETDE